MFSSVSSDTRLMSFAEVVTDRASDVEVTADGLIYAVKLVMVMTAKDGDHAGQALRNISHSLFDSRKFSERQMSTHGGAPTKLLSLQDAIELVMVLPGKVAKGVRTKFANIIRRYLAGDKTLVGEIKANAASDNPINRLARESMQADAGELERINKRKWELEDLGIAERRMVLQQGQAALTERPERFRIELLERQTAIDKERVRAPVEFVNYCMSSVENIPKGFEGRDKIRYTAMFNISADTQMRLATAAASGAAAAVNGEHGEVPAAIPIPTSISAVCSMMKITKFNTEDYKQIGKIAKKLYMKLHDKVPTQHNQLATDGKYYLANDYYVTDEPLLKDAIDEYIAKQKIKGAWSKAKSPSEDDYCEIDKIAKRIFVNLHIGDMPTQRSPRTFNEKWIMANDLHTDEELLLRVAVNEFLSKRKK
jgi:hypothetical protein